jgi:hypothetical protein
MTEHREEISTQDPTPKESLLSQARIGVITLFILVLLSAVGIGVTNFSPRYGLYFWMAMAPVFGGTSIYLAWSRVSRKEDASESALIRKQTIHWIGFLLAVSLVFVLYSTGKLNAPDSGLVALLVLALATFLAGVYGDGRMSLIGILLGAVVGGAALLEKFIWMIALPLIAALVLGMIWWRRKKGPSPR